MRSVLYGDLGSGHVAVEAALLEAGLPYRLARVRLDRQEQLGAAYRAVNPLGRLPSLVLPEGTVVAESVACLPTLADRHPESGLLPPERSAARAGHLRWLLFAACNLYDAIGRWDYPERFTLEPSGAEGIARAARARIREHWSMLEAHAVPEPLQPEEGPCALALLIAVIASWRSCVGRGWIDANCPRVASLRDAVWLRPALETLWLRNFAPIERAKASDRDAVDSLTESACAPWI